MRADVEDCCRKLKRYSRDVAEEIAKACKIYGKWSQRVTQKNARSSAVWFYGLTVLEHDYSPAKAVAVCEHSMAFIEKYDGRPLAAERQIQELFQKFSRARSANVARGVKQIRYENA